MDEAQRPAPTITRVALTGATGFIGSELQRRLIADGFSVRALVRPASLRRARVEPGVEVREVSLARQDALRSALQGVDAVVYAAGAVRGRRFDDFRPANVEGLANVCAAVSVCSPPPWLLLISSLAATRPELSDYARSKREGETIVRALPGKAWAILRPPAVYGPGDREMLPLFRAIRSGFAPIPGPPAQRLSFLHVADLARAVAVCLRCPDIVGGATFELDDGHAGGYAWGDIVAATRGRLPVVRCHLPRRLLAAVATLNVLSARVTGRLPMLTPGKVRELSEKSWLCNNRPFTSVVDWSPEVRLAEGVRCLFATPPGSGSIEVDV